MSKTYTFTENQDQTDIVIVVNQIQTIERDDFSDCTQITLVGGKKIAVSESVSDVTKVVNDA